MPKFLILLIVDLVRSMYIKYSKNNRGRGPTNQDMIICTSAALMAWKRRLLLWHTGRSCIDT